MIRQQLTIPQWLEMPGEVKVKMIDIFNIPKSDGCIVHNNTIMSDGHTHSDLAHVSVLKMQEFLDSKEEDFWKLLHETEEKIGRMISNEEELSNEKQQEEEKEDMLAKAEALGELAKKMGEVAKSAEVVIKRGRGRPKKV